MRVRGWVAAGVVLTAGVAMAAGAPLRETLAGVYKYSFQNGLVSGERYRSEDILEIVPTGPKSVYFRTELEFFNGHQCSLSGIAHLEGPELVYREPESRKILDRACALHLARKGPNVAISDEGGSCQAYCGARGSLSDVTFKYSSRRTIRYMARLKASSEFKEALQEDAKAGR
jgi:hypothetical protein